MSTIRQHFHFNEVATKLDGITFDKYSQVIEENKDNYSFLRAAYHITGEKQRVDYLKEIGKYHSLLDLHQHNEIPETRKKINIPIRAARYGNIDIIAFFLDLGMNIDEFNDSHCNMLTTAIRYHQNDVFSFLVDKGADLTKTAYSSGDTPIDFAARYNSLFCFDRLMLQGIKITDRSAALCNKSPQVFARLFDLDRVNEVNLLRVVSGKPAIYKIRPQNENRYDFTTLLIANDIDSRIFPAYLRVLKSSVILDEVYVMVEKPKAGIARRDDILNHLRQYLEENHYPELLELI